MEEKDTKRSGADQASVKPKIRIQKINKEEKPEGEKSKGIKLDIGKKVEAIKAKAKDKFDEYLDDRKEKLNRNDAIFSESLRVEKKQAEVLVKGGIDKGFLACVLLLLVFGAIMAYSASSVYAQNKYDDSAYFLKRHIGFIVLGIVASIPAVVFMTPRYWKLAGVGIYCGTVVLLLAVLVIGSSRGGAQRWIELGPITIQPSEIAKMALIMVLALYMSKHEKEVTSTHQFGGSFKHGVLVPGCIIAVIIGLVALEKHISGIIIIGMIGAFFSEGHIIVSGQGALVAEGKYKHAIATDGYYYQRPGATVAVTAAAKNALHVKGDDEDMIGAWFKGGMFYARVASTAGKGVKCDYDIVIDGGKFDIETSGNAEYDSAEADTSSAAGIKSDTHIEISGGELVFKSTGSGGKGINCDGSLTINDGNLNLTTTGKRYEYNKNTTSSPKAIKVDGAIIINGGVIDINVTGASEGSEGMESKSSITFNGGEIMVKSYDDGINAKSDITINGGKIYTYGTNNDGMDSNGKLNMKGGLVIGVGSNAPETGVDVDVSSNWTISGGTMIGFGGSMMASPSTSSPQCMLVYNGLSATAGQEITLCDNEGNVIVSFEYPLTKSGATLLLSCPEIKKSSTYQVWQGGTISNPADEWMYWSVEGTISGGTQLNTFTPSSTITTIGSSSGGGPGGGGGGGGGGWPGGGGGGWWG